VDIVGNPRHPYTRALIASVDARGVQRDGAVVVSGEIPSPMNPPGGCPYHTRCPQATARCASEKPVLRTLGSGHWVACHHAETLAPMRGVIADSRAAPHFEVPGASRPSPKENS
jgi:oligopeptide/dipeptide ABC transporter ATP-binding protein